MSTVPTLEFLSTPLRALRLLAVDFPDLPAPAVSVTAIYPDRLSLDLHASNGGFTAFEAWRAALGIDPARVDFHVQGNGRTAVLTVTTDYCAEIELTAYADVPAMDTVTMGGAA